MKKTYLISFILIFSLTRSFGQIEFVQQYDIKDKSLSVLSHITDNEGNTYVVCNIYPFYNDNGGRCGGGRVSRWGYNIVLFKFNTSGFLVWEKPISYNVAYVKQMYITDSCVFIPFLIGTVCEITTNGHAGGIEGGASINGGMLINRYSGQTERTTFFGYKEDMDILKNAAGYRSDSLIDHELLCVAMHKDKSISYLLMRSDDSWKPGIKNLLLIDRNDTLGFVKKTCFGAMNYLQQGSVAFDTYNDEYIIADIASLMIYNKAGILIRQLPLQPIKDLRNPIYKITFNDQYYVVNYGNEVYQDDYRNLTVVFNKQGKQISLKETPHYDVLNIDKDNIIYAVPQRKRYEIKESDLKPVSITCMDVQQVVVEEKHFGMPYVIAGSISFTNKNDMVVTGTSATTESQKLPKTPDGAYFYKESNTK